VVCAARQGCLVHLLRDLHTVDHYFGCIHYFR